MAKKSSARRERSGTVESSGNLIGMSTRELQAELQRRQQGITRLQARREKILSQVAEIDREIASLGGVVVGGIGLRPRNEKPLSDVLAEVLKGRKLSVTDAAHAAIEAGYRTSAENFRTIVNQTLIKDDRFKNISRGIYTAK